MSVELIACVGATLAVVSPATKGSFSILPIGGGSMGSDAACQGKEIYTSISFTVTGVVVGVVASGSGAGVIAGEATKVNAGGLPVVRKSDSVEITVTDAQPPYGTENVTVEVDDPGQQKARAA